ncbi:MAG: DNA mismatch repair endonuclease MutL [Pirellulaceae bacterium]
MTSSSPARDIRRLPASVVNKIAAGEVIERPASVVKELLENSVDAGATRVDVSVEQGGSELIRISDDGHGIRADQLVLAVASHATSKIGAADDLFHVRSLGFRGEALASIAEVSQFLLRSRTADAEAGAELVVTGGQASEVQPCGCPVGTTLEVRNLFFNTPVRRKFLRTTQTEMGHTIESFTRLALAYPDKHLTLRHNERLVYDLPAVDRWLDRIAAFFGNELGDSLIWVESCHESVRLTGYVADPSVSRGNNRMQYLLLNGRPIRDRSLQHALGEAYRGLLLTGRFPVAFLRLDIPPEMVDVNVHPAKLEVRFADGRQLYSQLLATLRNKFLTTDLTARAQLHPAAEDVSDHGHDRQEGERHREATRNWARGGTPAAAGGASPHLPWGESFTSAPAFRPFGQADTRSAPAHVPDPVDPQAMPARVDPSHAWPPRPVGDGLQVHNRYLVTETEEGLVVIDQHALHERILYEQLRARVLGGTLESQRLLVPEPVTLAPTEAAAALEARDVLARLGMDVEPFGGDTVLVSSYPAMLANFNPTEVLRQLVEQLLNTEKPPDRRDLLDDLLHMISCKAAVKAGDRLSSEEVQALLEQRHHYQDAHHCPHGRPTSLVFTNAELDKRFKRSG